MQNPDIWSDTTKVSKLGQEIKEKKDILSSLNIQIEEFGINSFRVVSHPT